jgi:2-polyprenyl-3-methyl-5-hydroxy-6-metoxy-1,4-benzoquinol methylase
VLDIGCGQGYVAEEMARIADRVVGVDQYIRTSSDPKIEFRKFNLDAEDVPVPVSDFDQIFMLDVIEHLRDPEIFMEKLRTAAANKRPEIILTTANIGFFITRMALLFGQFNYGRKGILDRTHTRLFTFRSLRELFEQTGFKIEEMRGIPAPFPKAVGNNALGRLLVSLNQLGIGVLRGLFSYQIYVRARALPTVSTLLRQTEESSAELRRTAVVG